MSKRYSFVILTLIISLLSGCVRDSSGVSRTSLPKTSDEIELGEAIHQQILQTMPVYDEPELNRYVREIGEKIISQAERRDLQYRFVILNDDRMYATHVPGGYVYVTTGFFRFLQNEIELAGLLAYEIGALQYRDPRLSRLKKVFEAVLRTGSMVGPAFGSIGALAVIGLVVAGNFIGQEKAFEERLFDADRDALQYLAGAGYDPQGLIDLLRRINDPHSPARPYLYDFLQSHPLSVERFRKLEETFWKLPLENHQFNAGREAYLAATQKARETIR